jgi:hypothetical protein
VADYEFPDDPIEERFVHARDLLDSKYNRGKGVEGDDILDVRDDLVFLYRMARREQHVEHALINSRITLVEERVSILDKIKLNRVPAVFKAAWILLPVVAGFILTIIWATSRGAG